MSKKDSSDVFVSVALGSRDRSFSIWSTDLKRPLIVINDVFDQSVLDLSWRKDGKVRSARSGQTETVSVRFQPKNSAGFGISVFSLFGVSAEIPYFGRTFQYKVNCQNWLFIAETGYFGRKRDLAKISVSAEISAFLGGLFRFRCFGQKSVSFDQYVSLHSLVYHAT